LKIAPNCIVELEYEITSPDGTVFETSADAGVMSYLHGSDEIPPRLASALEGKEVGNKVVVDFEVGEAFGPYNPDGLVSVPREEFPPDAEVVPGDWVELLAQSEEGEEETIEACIVEIAPDAIVLDANHPLANEAVKFAVTVVSVTEA